MNTARCVLVSASLFVVVSMLPSGMAWAASTPPPKGQKGKQMPSVRLRQMIDHTLPQLVVVERGKEPTNRGALTEAQAEWTALAQTASPAEQPIYAAAANVVQMLLAAEEEHTTAVANYQYSKSVHGKQDHQDARISNGGQAPGTAFANNAKQNQENAQFRKEEIRKEQFMNKGASGEWSARVETMRTSIEQAYTAELVTEKQTLLAKAATPPPIPRAPKSEPSAALRYSPAGSWNMPKGQWTLGEDGTFSTAIGTKGTWQWTDQSKRQIGFHWNNGGEGSAVFSDDGKSLKVTMPKGGTVSLSR
ncbi:MAG TPA: hypothetical protein VGM54_20750 [Chthoniobacter sp.]